MYNYGRKTWQWKLVQSVFKMLHFFSMLNKNWDHHIRVKMNTKYNNFKEEELCVKEV